MLYNYSFISLLEVIIVVVPSLLSVAFVTVAERKTMASMQRRLGPNIVGYYGLLQAFADALKLLLKEYVSPTQANLVLFFLGPVVTLIFSLLGFSVISYGPGLMISDFNLGILYMLAMSSLSTYGILLAGWSANSKYAFLGSLRSTAQLISYELILSSAILVVILFSGSLNLSANIEIQKSIWFIIPLLPVFIIFFIGSIAETNRAPFDLAEAESELVSGFMTEHAAVIFVFFFLAEYASILLICILTSMLFLGGYLININSMYNVLYYTLSPILYLIQAIEYIAILFFRAIFYIIYIFIIVINTFDIYIFSIDKLIFYINMFEELVSNFLFKITYSIESLFYSSHEYILSSSSSTFFINYIIQSIIYGIILGIKSCIMVFTFILARASFPRIRYDQLMSYCWTILLPLIVAIIILFPCILYSFSIIPINIYS